MYAHRLGAYGCEDYFCQEVSSNLRLQAVFCILPLLQPTSTSRRIRVQFNGVSVDYARRVRHFLELLGVRVVTGEGYEPKPINEKVRHRLQEALDFVVVIEVRERSSVWTRDEIARAQQPGVLLIPLVEQGATFDRGIFGDHEYIEFAPGHIGDAFTGLLEAVTYIRRLRIDTDTS